VGRKRWAAIGAARTMNMAGVKEKKQNLETCNIVRGKVEEFRE